LFTENTGTGNAQSRGEAELKTDTSQAYSALQQGENLKRLEKSILNSLLTLNNYRLSRNL
jgi:hypothetical protein